MEIRVRFHDRTLSRTDLTIRIEGDPTHVDMVLAAIREAMKSSDRMEER